MSITRLQQARQMYAMGKRVERAFGGVMGPDGRKAYVGGSYSGSTSSSGKGSQGSGKGYQGGSAAPGSAEAEKDGGGSRYKGGSGDPGGYKSTTGKSTPTGTLTGDDYKDARRDYQRGISRVGPFDNRTGYTGPAYQPLTKFGYTQNPYQNFLDYRPEINIPNFGFLGMAANLAKKPIQKFADFTTEKNRNYFMDEVVRAGRIPGLDFGTVRDMSGEELEAAYKGYLSDRLNNKTDAYGNPNPGYDGGGGGEGANQGIATLYNNNMFDDTETENPNNLFASRFLQNQPDDIREGIEARMQDYYTV